jgi:hypothetical protein
MAPCSGEHGNDPCTVLRMFKRNVCAHMVLAGCVSVAAIRAQDQTPAPNQSDKKESSGGTSNDRLFFTLPNFLTLENATDAPPMTAGEKFKVTARGTFDPMEFAFYGVEAGFSQLGDHDADYGQGMEGYAKRFAVRVADGTVENFFTRAIYPSLLHQDPRYFQKGKGGFWSRTTYAVSRVFVTRSDAGAAEFNFSEILGSATAAGVSVYSYHPQSAHNLTSAMDVWGTQIGYDTLSYVLKEFWPDIRCKLHKSKPQDQAAH